VTATDFILIDRVLPYTLERHMLSLCILTGRLARNIQTQETIFH